MSLQLHGILDSVPLADEGYYIDENGLEVYVNRSGRHCKGLFFNLLIGTLSGGLFVSNTVRYSVLAISKDKHDADNIPLDCMLNFGSVVASKIAANSKGVIMGFSVDFGLYRDDEMYSNLCMSFDNKNLGVQSKVDRREIDDSMRDVILTYPGEFFFKIPFFDSDVVSPVSKNDLTLNVFNADDRDFNVQLTFGYLKFEDSSKNSIIGVLAENIFYNKVQRSNTSFVPSHVNNDSGVGFDVVLDDFVISKKYY